MALKATIYKAQLQLADMDRGVYADHSLTLARHPSENDERLMLRLLAFALRVPADDHHGMLEFTRGLDEPDEPPLWQKDLTGALVQWIDLGQPDERRLIRAAGRAEQVVVYASGSSVPIWWQPLEQRVARAANLEVWQVPADQTQALAALADRGMRLAINVQDGTAWVSQGERSVEVTPVRLKAAGRR
ncbi:YaeQ family protein [Aquabacterium sp. J223]|uniref:YaeQ family protein n=1 Tax=Aquabacterium sp. J223 TaxID=2898431 RepID=UPI0021AD734D|nr:YaeQ family protein [Aquabacterium sp. J223]UUX94109.1 YaeQ family protein [Aquabacterium sp. J223]